jgi:hypothetical protein
MAESDNVQGLIDVTLLRYKFRFRRLSWREELAMRRDRDKKKDPVRQFLSQALHDVSGLIPPSLEKSEEVVSSIPEAIVARVWKVYRGSLPPSRMFTTTELYQAPEPSVRQYHIAEEDMLEDSLHDRAIREMESRYGKQEVAEEADLSRRVLEAARRGGSKFAPATPEGGKGARQ